MSANLRFFRSKVDVWHSSKEQKGPQRATLLSCVAPCSLYPLTYCYSKLECLNVL